MYRNACSPLGSKSVKRGLPTVLLLGIIILSLVVQATYNPSSVAGRDVLMPGGAGTSYSRPSVPIPYSGFPGHFLGKMGAFDGLSRALGHFSPNSASTLNGSEAFTIDSKVVNNTGISSTLVIPSSWTAPAKGCDEFKVIATYRACVFLGVGEPVLNPLTPAYVGAWLLQTVGAGASEGAYPGAVLPNGTLIINPMPSNLLTAGGTYNFSIVHSSGSWWNFDFGSKGVTGGAAWANGTYDLGTDVAVGIFHNSTTEVDPAQFLAELNGSFPMPEVTIPTAMEFETKGATSVSYQPASGNALALNYSSPLGIEGKIQNPSLPDDEVVEAGNLAFPGDGQPLWGSAAPLGALTPQAEVYVTEPAVSGNIGMSLTLIVPGNANITLTEQQGEFYGIQEPLNTTLEVGVGIYEFIYGGSLRAAPFYFVRAGSNSNIYFSSTLVPKLGSAATLNLTMTGGGWWKFTMDGSAIASATSGPGNGSASLGLSASDPFVTGSNLSGPADSLFEVSSVPIFGVFGNATIGNAEAVSSLSFEIPGHGWDLADYAYGWAWGTAVDLDGQSTLTTIPRGEVLFGDIIRSPHVNPGGLLWEGILYVALASKNSTILSGLNETVSANVTSGIAIPSVSSLSVSGSLGDPSPVSINLTFSLSGSGTDWAKYNVAFVAPPVNSSSGVNATLNFTVSATSDYHSGNGSIALHILPERLVIAVRPSSVALTAGQTASIYVFVNDSLGQVNDATISVTGTPSVGAYVTAAHSISLGEYLLNFTPPASLESETNYSITFYANESGSAGGIGTITISVAPLPPLTVVLQASTPAGGVYSGTKVTFYVNVTSASVDERNASISLASSGWVTQGGITDSNGTFTISSDAPTVSVNTTFKITATAQLRSFRTANSSLNITVLETPSGPSLSGVALAPSITQVQVGKSIAFTASVTCTTDPCPPEVGYTWTLSDQLGSLNVSSGTKVTFTAGSVVGNVTLTVTATLYGVNKTTTAEIMIEKSTPSSSSTSFFSGSTLYIILAVVIAAVAAAGIALYMIRRRKAGPQSDSAGPGNEPPAGPPQQPPEWSEG